MTANVAQVFLTDEDWAATLSGVLGALRPGGLLVFEVRDPAATAWLEWDRDHTHRRVDLPGVGVVETWCDLMGVEERTVSFRHTFVFDSDGATLTSDSTLAFRERRDVERSLAVAGFVLDDVRDAPDRPGLEHVFRARRPTS